MAMLSDPFDALLEFQQALDTYRTSSWLGTGLSSGGASRNQSQWDEPAARLSDAYDGGYDG